MNELLRSYTLEGGEVLEVYERIDDMDNSMTEGYEIWYQGECISPFYNIISDGEPTEREVIDYFEKWKKDHSV